MIFTSKTECSYIVQKKFLQMKTYYPNFHGKNYKPFQHAIISII
jgi:hypothetical protein